MKSNFTETRIPTLDKPDSEAYLYCSTDKQSQGGIYSRANVFFARGGLRTFEVFGDYRRVLERSPEKRGTQKNVDEQHARIFTPDTIAALVEEAKGFYANKAAKRVQS